MSRRRGILALWLLFVMAALIAVGAGVLRASSHALQAVITEEKGLTAQYAAESGAVWGLAYVKENGLATKSVRLTLHDDATALVKLTLTEESENGVQKGKIHSTGEETERGLLRYVGLTIEAEKDGDKWRVIVRDVGNKKT